MRGDIFKKTCEYILVLMMVCILFLTGCSESNDTDEDDMIKAEESSGISAVSLVSHLEKKTCRGIQIIQECPDRSVSTT